MNTISISSKSLLGGLLAGFLLAAVLIVPFVGVSRVEAAIGTGCGDATGKNVTISGTTLTDPTKVWKPNPDRWKDGTLMITGSSVLADVGKKGTVTASTATTITISSWTPSAPTGANPNFSYTVTAKPNVCSVVVVTGDPATGFSCLQTGDAGFCKGPCSADSQCAVFLVGGASDAGFGGTKCSSADALKPGVCLELPRSDSRLQDAALTTSGAGLLTLVDTVTNWIFAVFTVLAIIFILLAAFQFITGGGDEAKISEARQKLIWAAVGIIIALLAKGLVPVIRSIVGG